MRDAQTRAGRAWARTGVGAALLATALAGCAGDAEPERRPTLAEQFPLTAICPPVAVRIGTELIQVFAGGREGDPAALRYQASFTGVGRDCAPASGATAITVTATGRVIEGIAGAGTLGTVTLPVRIETERGGAVVSSVVRPVAVTFAPGQSSVTWSLPPEVLAVPDAEAATPHSVFVGFDVPVL